MLNKLWICICLLVILPGLLLVTSCAKKDILTEQMSEETAPAMEEKATEQEQVAAVDSQAAEEVNTVQKEEESQTASMVSQEVMNDDIYFDFDSSVLKNTAKDELVRKTEWLRENPDASLIIEGHCDERGTSAYNIALGDRRAQSAMAFFVDMGIDANQLSTISYGEERPVNIAQTEEAWSKNRRAHFEID
ncbi:MAG: peptidoglycan-associated lipoprotein Pal [Thermodesulfobacteriota bacterium]